MITVPCQETVEDDYETGGLVILKVLLSLKHLTAYRKYSTEERGLFTASIRLPS
jgi:hypothetical protein